MGIQINYNDNILIKFVLTKLLLSPSFYSLIGEIVLLSTL